ncbi:MAG: primosomal protein N' (replication factor Y) [Planctomycetota bacterium]|jgi:primosomal protein N' (replication factor Y)
MASRRSRRFTEESPGLFPELIEEEQAPPEPPLEQMFSGVFAEVALNRPLRTEFSYHVPDELEADVVPGVRVAVPFGSRREIGVVVRVNKEAQFKKGRVRDVFAVLDKEPILDKGLLDLTQWMATEYACAWGQTLGAVLPAPLKREREARKQRMLSAVKDVAPEVLVELREKWEKQHRLLRTLMEIGEPIEYMDVIRKLKLSDSPAKQLIKKGLAKIEYVEPVIEELSGSGKDRLRPEKLSLGQMWAVKLASAKLEAREGETFVVQGVTGSGKTEVYLRVIELALELGRGAIVLVPEIALTPQTVGWFQSRFKSVAVLHSRMTDTQRLRMWMKVKRGEARVVVGARSAIFAPVHDLGVVVVDEEHEPSFKQGITPRYHARDVAVKRAKDANAVCLLGSATPSLESWHRAMNGDFRFMKLPERIGGRELPPVELVDMKIEPKTKARKHGAIFSVRLEEALGETLKLGQQSILFLNRRGFTPVLWCVDCHATISCEQCSSSLSYHRRINRMVCHVCCEERPYPKACTVCTSPRLSSMGMGVERVESALKEILPKARVRRMDSDTMLRREDYEKTLSAFGREEIDVLVGTQMIAKGLDFPGVTLVGIISADTSLNLPDFRSYERTFQLIEQVSGRAGRGEHPGRVVVQTQSLDSSAIRLAAQHDFDGFAAKNIKDRSEFNWPPFARLIRAVFEHEDAKLAEATSHKCADALRSLGLDKKQLLGPSGAPVEKIRNRFRRELTTKCPSEELHIQAREVLIDFAAKNSRGRNAARIAIDVDPVSFF